MQATVYSFDDDTHDGSVVLDSGQLMHFTGEAFAASGLRMLRTGQRVRIKADDQGDVAELTILTLPPPNHS